MPVYADNSIPANLCKTPADGFSRVDSVADCGALFLIRDGANVREMTDAEKAQYYPPEPIPEPTPQEKRAATYAAKCDPILVQIEGYKLENEITGTNGKDSRITELKVLWKEKRDAIRAQYPDEV